MINNIKKFFVCAILVIFNDMTSMAQTAFNWQEILVKPGCFAPLPKSNDSFWRDSIPRPMRDSYIKYGEQYLGRQWTALPFTLFSEFKTNGNRTRYEAVNFERRRQLAALVMAEIMEGKGRFMNDIINGMGCMCEETWWGIPAHYGHKFPIDSDQTVDLFNAETAGLVAWIRYMLEPQLESFAPGFCKHIDKEIERRILRPALAYDYWWKKAGMNWNPWICSNWLTCILMCESDRDKQIEGVSQVAKAMEAFIAAYPDDGGCDEGTGYWDRAAASLYECMRLMRIATDKKADMMTPKVERMMDYIYKMYIGNGYCVNFADAHENKMQAQPNIIVPMALDTNNQMMRDLAAHSAAENSLFTNPAPVYDHSGNFPALGRELFMLRQISEAMAIVPNEPDIKDVWLPNLQIMTARRGEMYVAVKGGNNGESHNHNDVGNFIVYANGQPLIIDLGVGEYTSATFGKDRYSIWTMQSAYHNLPLINGVMQKDGKEYAARLINRSNGRLTLDIAGAYSVEAAVRSWRRTVGISNKAVEVSEDYCLSEHKAPSQIVLMTTVLPVVAKPGGIALGNYGIEYSPAQLSPEIEDVSGKMDALLRGVWGQEMYRIVLTVRQNKIKDTIKYRIAKMK